MGRLGWSDNAMRRHDDARARDIAWAQRRKREAREATEAAWADWNAQEARARVMRLDVTAPAEDADWRTIGKATAALLVLIESELDAPYEDARELDRDSAGYGYRAGGPDCGDRGVVVAELSEEVF